MKFSYPVCYTLVVSKLFKFLFSLLFLISVSSCNKSLNGLKSDEESTLNQVAAEDIKWRVDSVYKMIVFNTFDDYRRYWECSEKDKIHEKMNQNKFLSLFKSLPKIKKEYERRTNAGLTQFNENYELPWFFDEELVNFTQLLNPDGLLTIDE